MKGSDGIGCILLLIIVAAVVILVGGPLVGSAAEGFAKGGGSIEARAFTSETYSSATAGDNGVAVAVQGDGNNIALAYSQAQPTPTPDRNAQDARETRAWGGLALTILAAAVVIIVLAVLLGFV